VAYAPPIETPPAETPPGTSPGGTPTTTTFAAGLPFSLSDYQRRALAALDAEDESVVVVAPTGSGKSVIADAAIWQALSRGATAAYVSPLRALANQRFAQLDATWGERAGLMTGERVVRPLAPCRVVTAELFRTLSLLPRLEDDADPLATYFRALGWAVFDEAHYLADPQRGSAWEEAILATPPTARLLCLSATVGDPGRLVAWLRWLGRPVTLVETEERPVPLRHYLFLRGDLHLVQDEHGAREGTFPFAGGWALARRRGGRPLAGPPGRRRPAGRPGPLPGLPTVPPDDWVRDQAVAALRLLREREMTPAIAFVPSRRETERLAAAAGAAFPEAAGGVAAHHGGLSPAARRDVETRLAAGDLWLVCATTTLAAGLDVPARSVLLTSFGRFDGRAFVLLSPAEYRQISGRAGRLGRDSAGSAVLLPSPWHGFEEAFRALTAPLPPIGSAFRPTYATALAWWTGGPAGAPPAAREARLASALAGTFAAFLRRSRGGRDAAALPPPTQPDGPSRIEAHALGRLLERDGLAAPDGALTAAGAFVLRVAGGAEGRLLLRLGQDGAFDGLPDGVRVDLLAALAAGGPGPDDDPAVAGLYGDAHRRQVAVEHETGARLTPPPAPAAPGRGGDDGWRRRQGAADLLERALRAARAADAAALSLTLTAWGPALLDRLR
jgi:hypothetical protein